MPQREPRRRPSLRGVVIKQIGWRNMPVIEDRLGNRLIAFDHVPYGKVVGYQTVERMEIGSRPFLTIRDDFEAV